MCSSLKGFFMTVPLKATSDKWKFRFCLRGMLHTATEIVSPSPRCDAHRRDFFEIWSSWLQIDHKVVSLVGSRPWRQSPRCVAHRRDRLLNVLHTEDRLQSVLHTAEIDSVVESTPPRQLCDRISRRNQDRIRKYFSLFTRAPDGVESWKKWR